MEREVHSRAVSSAVIQSHFRTAEMKILDHWNLFLSSFQTNAESNYAGESELPHLKLFLYVVLTVHQIFLA